MGLLYIIGDIVLLIIAGTLLVAFWGGPLFPILEADCDRGLLPLHRRYVFFAYAVNVDAYVEGSLWGGVLDLLSSLLLARGQWWNTEFL